MHDAKNLCNNNNSHMIQVCVSVAHWHMLMKKEDQPGKMHTCVYVWSAVICDCGNGDGDDGGGGDEDDDG